MADSLTVADQERRTRLRRMKAAATALLVATAITYLVTLKVGSNLGASAPVWLGYLRSAAEAGMVGGLADWFAVTALFRRPLGLPIPHTAIIPTRKDAIGESLGDFVGTNFLSESVVRGRLASAEIARRTGTWLIRPDSAERVAEEVTTAVRGAIEVLSDEDVQAVIEHAVTRRLAGIPVGPALGRLLDGLVRDGAHHGVVDLVVDNTHTWLLDHRQVVVDVVARQAPSWSPRFVDERIAELVYNEVLRVAGEVRADPMHPLRRSLDEFLVAFAESLRTDPLVGARVDEIKSRLLDHPDVHRAVADVGGTLRRLLLEAVDDPQSELRLRAVAALREFGQRLVDDAEVRAKLDGWLGDVAAYVVRSYRAEITTVITDTVQRWDGVETSRRIEIQVGRDLQFIRINGTVVGALAGVAIYAISQLVT